MSDETRRVLDLLAQGKITADEAEQLLTALMAPSAERPTAEPSDADAPRAPRRWVHINVHKNAHDGHREKDVNIRVPIAVVKGGMRLGAIIATFAGEKAAQRMKARGLDLDLSAINGDLSRMNGVEFDTFMRSLDETNVEVDDGKSQVRITTE